MPSANRCERQRVVRLWYKDGTYMDVTEEYAVYYENDPEWDHTEDVDDLDR